MIDRVLCALLFKCTAFGLHPGNSRLSLSLSLFNFSLFFFLLYFDIDSHGDQDQIFIYIAWFIQMFHRACYRSIGRAPIVTAIMRDLFCSSVSFFFSPLRLLCFPENSYTRWVNAYGFEESLVYRWFFLFLSSRLYSCGFTRWHDATRLHKASFVFSFVFRISNFQTKISTNFRRIWSQIFERAFLFPLYFSIFSERMRAFLDGWMDPAGGLFSVEETGNRFRRAYSKSWILYLHC